MAICLYAGIDANYCHYNGTMRLPTSVPYHNIIVTIVGTIRLPAGVQVYLITIMLMSLY